MEFSLYIGYNDVDCDVRQEIPGRFASDIVIQHHGMIVTGADVGLKVQLFTVQTAYCFRALKVVNTVQMQT